MAGLAKLHRGIVTDRGGPLRAGYVDSAVTFARGERVDFAAAANLHEKMASHVHRGSFCTLQIDKSPPYCCCCAQIAGDHR